MYDLIVLIDKKVSAATSMLLLPWVMRARISDSRSVRPSVRPGQSSPVAGRAWVAWAADDDLAGVNGLQCGDELAGGERLGEVAAGSFGGGAGDQVGMEVPRVDDDAAGVGVVDQHVDLVVVCFGLGERVVEHDVDVVGDAAGWCRSRRSR